MAPDYCIRKICLDIKDKISRTRMQNLYFLPYSIFLKYWLVDLWIGMGENDKGIMTMI